MTGGPFAAEKAAKAIWPDRYEAWICRYASPATRTRLTAFVAIIGIFVASFLAFNDERSALLKANEDLETARGYPSNPYKPLSVAQTQILTEAFRSLPPPNTFLVTVTADRSAADLTEQIRKALKPVISGIVVQPGWLSGEDSRCGICFEVAAPDNLNERQKAYLAAFSKAGIRARVTNSFDADLIKNYDFVLFVGPNR